MKSSGLRSGTANQRRFHLEGHEYLGLLIVLLAACLAYLPAAIQGGWFSDDYILVYGIDAQPPAWAVSIRTGGAGRLSVARLLCYPFIGYLGGWLGAQWSHVLALFLHLLCGVMLYFLLRRLSWPHRAAGTAIFLFLVAPWAVQPVVWWSAVCTTVSSIFVLAAVHAFVTWYPQRGSIAPLLLVQAAIFIALLVYELWLGSFALFWMLAFYFERRKRNREGGALTWGEAFRRATLGSWPVILPYLLWGTLYLATLTHEPDVRAPHTSLLRIAVTLLSIHLRTYHWFLDTPWPFSIPAGWVGLWSLAGLVCLVIMIVSLVAGRRLQSKRQSQSVNSNYRVLPGLGDMVLVAWGLFLGSRLVFILQGAVSTHTRHSYGAAMGFAIAASWFFWWWWEACESRVALRRAVTGIGIFVAVLMVTATSGLALHAARVSQAEQYTHDFLRTELARLPAAGDILIVGDATGSRGEMPYYGEGSGWWLEYRLRHVLAGRRVYVLEDIAPGTESVRLSRFGKEELLSLDRITVYRWRERELVRDGLMRR